MLEKFNKIISLYLDSFEINDINEFAFINRLINIYKSHCKTFNIPIYKTKVPIDRSYSYSYNFLKSINPIYAQYLEEAYKNGAFEFVDDKIYPCSYVDIENGQKRIFISTNYTVQDSYDITHELIHYISLEEDISDARNIFCETLSYLSEELQYEFFDSSMNVKEYQINSMKNLLLANQASEILKNHLLLIDIYLRNGIITIDDVMHLYEQSKNKNLYTKTIEDIINKEDLFIIDNHRVVVGIIFAYYMLDRIHMDSKNMQEFFELNEIINAYDIESFVNYLDLDCKDADILDLTEESYQRLEDSFIRVLKSR